MLISIVVAMDENGCIGYQNRLPWHIPEELKYFKSLTLEKSVIMGRKTFVSIGKPLPNRQNIVLSTNKNFKADNINIVHSPDEALKMATSDEIMIIGGLEVFNLFLPKANKLYISTIDGQYACDTYFPKIDYSKWNLVSKKEYKGFIAKILIRKIYL
jgi:dihydrofolate reductase